MEKLREALMTVHVFGDSHGNYLFSRTEQTILHCTVGRTMHRVARDGIADMVQPVHLGVDDTVIFVFGEIDVRCHLLRVAASKGRSLQEEANDLADRYITALRNAFAGFPSRPRICIMGVVPPIDPLVQNPILPHTGTLSERLVAWFLLNEALRAQAQKYKCVYVEIPARYRSLDGSLKRRYSDGIAHIAKDCSEAAVRAVEKALGMRLAFRRLPVRRNFMRTIMRQIAILNDDYAVLWTLGESNVDR
ncbi:hypothetical protein Q8W71_25500 [Methylobacterium sp. NEAU 140]|uniref:hypothetical protein n=1 Tax=Methylobacterium sp. NEAU 140 TaxID=3064945 RepID=UPI002733849C|nr:hypothetical protein [Methylobacterium sp. NEAU 140]MDP4025993.1 hypothetical protein [Methylobacterium sp. NEAU 140]